MGNLPAAIDNRVLRGIKNHAAVLCRLIDCPAYGPIIRGGGRESIEATPNAASRGFFLDEILFDPILSAGGQCRHPGSSRPSQLVLCRTPRPRYGPAVT